MNRKSFLTVTAASLLLLPFAIANPQTSEGGADVGVTVLNTSANPVPVTMLGSADITGTVNIANQPTVDARQSGNWWVGILGTPSVSISGTPTVALDGTPSVAISGTPTVAISGTPSVAISGTPTVSLAGTSAVTIANTAASPALVRDVGEDRQLYSKDFSDTLLEGEHNGCIGLFTVPAGRRLIVQQLDVELVMTSETEVSASFNITNGASDQYADHPVRLERNNPTSQYHYYNGPMLAYGAPGTQACLSVRRVHGTAIGTISGHIAVTGYTIPAS